MCVVQFSLSFDISNRVKGLYRKLLQSGNALGLCYPEKDLSSFLVLLAYPNIFKEKTRAAITILTTLKIAFS